MASFTVYCRHCVDHVPYRGLIPRFCPRCHRQLLAAAPLVKPERSTYCTPINEMDRRLLRAAKIAAD